MVVLWKVVCATRLALDPESLVKLIELFFIHHIYVWCRAFISIMETVGIFEEVRPIRLLRSRPPYHV